jgi:hypothetical protein
LSLSHGLRWKSDTSGYAEKSTKLSTLQTVRAVLADRRKSSARETASGRENRRKDWPLGPETEMHKKKIKADTDAWVKGSRTRPVAAQPRIAREDHGAEPSLK